MIKVSVIIPTYNRGYVLERAIRSVLNQTFKDFELIVIDDGSTDNTLNILESFKREDSRFDYISIDNRGVSHARNIGVKHSRGEWIALLDSDDEWMPHKLMTQLDFLQENKEIPLIHGEELWVRNGKRVNPKNKHRKSGGWIFEKCLPLCLISPSASILKKEVYEEFKGFDESFPVCEDYDLWLKITSKYPVGFIEEPILIKYGGHEDQLSRKYVAMDFWRVRSMVTILEKGTFPVQSKQKIIDEVLYKARILKQGYLKHQNFENYKFIDDIIGKYS